MRNGPSRTWILQSLCALCSAVPFAAYGESKLNDHWTFLGDFVYMKRADVHNHTLVKDSNKPQCPSKCPNHTVINNQDLVNDFDFVPGFRVAASYSPNARNSLEANYLYLQPWHGDKTRHGDQSLSFPLSDSDYSRDFTDADKAHAEYDSHFWDAEFNYLRNFCPRRKTYFSLSGIAGLRYFRWDEDFKLTMVNPPDKSVYSIHSKNRVYAGQLGLDFQMNPMRWFFWDFFAKVGFFANDSEQKQYMGDFYDSVTLRDSKGKKWETGFFSDVAAQFGFWFFDHINLHFGYQAMFFSGLCLAPEQISHRVNKDAGVKDHSHGNAIIHGLFAGGTLSF